MKKLMIVLAAACAVCFSQGKQNVPMTGTVDARNATWLPPTATFASPPSAPVTGSVYVFTDASSVGTCSGGGSALATCRWTGSAWSATGGGGGGGGGSSDPAIWSGGTQVQRLMQCATGTVASTALTAAAASQEITIQTGAGGSGISGNVRWDHVLISESTQFTGTTGLTVSMGRTGSSNYELTGTQVALGVSGGDANFWYARPSPPQLSSAYNVVLNFATTTGNVNAATAGSLTWELCGYAAR